MKKQIKIYFTDEQLDDLKLISTLEGESISFIIRTIVNDYLKYYLWKNSDSTNDKKINDKK